MLIQATLLTDTYRIRAAIGGLTAASAVTEGRWFASLPPGR